MGVISLQPLPIHYSLPNLLRLPLLISMDSVPILARLSLDCQTRFEILNTSLTSANGGKFALSSTAIDDELGRFRLWASNIGAINIGKASLDYRLRDVEYLHQNVKSLLEDLKESLREGIRLEFVSDCSNITDQCRRR